jgi:hypothetical protein
MKTEKIPYRDYEIDLKKTLSRQWQTHFYPTRWSLPLMPGWMKAATSSDREKAIAKAKAQIDDLLRTKQLRRPMRRLGR